MCNSEVFTLFSEDFSANIRMYMLWVFPSAADSDRRGFPPTDVTLTLKPQSL